MKKGEKYIIEISEVHTHYDDNGNKYPLARIKGFNSLVFDEFGLGKLEKVEEVKELAEEKPQYLNCRFVVLKNEDEFEKNTNNIKVGKVYDIVDGKVELPLGTFPLGDCFKNFDEVVAYFSGSISKDRILSDIGYYSAGTIKVARLEEDEE